MKLFESFEAKVVLFVATVAFLPNLNVKNKLKFTSNLALSRNRKPKGLHSLASIGCILNNNSFANEKTLKDVFEQIRRAPLIRLERIKIVNEQQRHSTTTATIIIATNLIVVRFGPVEQSTKGRSLATRRHVVVDDDNNNNNTFTNTATGTPSPPSWRKSRTP
jgi:hypothetical protein